MTSIVAYDVDPNDVVQRSIYPQFLPENNPGFPAITFAMDDDEEETLLDGTVAGLRIALFSIDCWDRSYITVHALASAVKTSLVGYVGLFGTLPSAQRIEQIRKEREIELYESDTELHRVSLQFSVAYFS